MPNVTCETDIYIYICIYIYIFVTHFDTDAYDVDMDANRLHKVHKPNIPMPIRNALTWCLLPLGLIWSISEEIYLTGGMIP